jgi:hypothetical protein
MTKPSTADEKPDSNMLPAALAFARRGHPVFPVNWPVPQNGRFVCSCMRHTRSAEPCSTPAKHPYGKLAPHGLLSATTESGIIKSWWGLNAREANLGVCTDKLVVIDLDPRHGSDESLIELDKAGLEFPRTWRALTGGGGEHIIFTAPDSTTISSFAAEQMSDPPLGRGIDIRAKGGYIVAPPSRHISGRPYAWSVDHHPAETPIAAPPDWLTEKLAVRATSSTKCAPVPSAEWEKLVTGPITEYRDMAAARIAGHLFRRWVDLHIVVSLMRGWNVMHCVPPLTDNELMRILNRIADKEADRLEREHSR